MVTGSGFRYILVHPPCEAGPSMFQLFDISWMVSHPLIAGVLHHPTGWLEVRSTRQARILHRSRGYNRYNIMVVPVDMLKTMPNVPFMILVTPKEFDQQGREYVRQVRQRADPVLHLPTVPLAGECGVHDPYEVAYERWLVSLRDYFKTTHQDLVADFDEFLTQPKPTPDGETRPVWRRQLTLPNDLVTVSLGWVPADPSTDANLDPVCESFGSVRAMRVAETTQVDYPPGYTSLVMTSAAVVRRLPAFVFVSAAQQRIAPGEVTFYLRHDRGLDTLGGEVRRALHSADARVPVVYMRAMGTQLDNITWLPRALTILVTLFAAGAMAVATVGQYAVTAFTTRKRLHEFGVRIALGATSRQILVSVLRQGLLLTAIGLAIGFGASVAALRTFGSLLYGVSPTDVPTYAAVVVFLPAISLVACYLPAKRAAGADPIDALRRE